MVKSVQKVWKCGQNNLVVSIRKEIRDMYNIKAGDLIEIDVIKLKDGEPDPKKQEKGRDAYNTNHNPEPKGMRIEI